MVGREDERDKRGEGVSGKMCKEEAFFFWRLRVGGGLSCIQRSQKKKNKNLNKN